MKKLFILFLFLPLGLFAQTVPTDSVTGKYTVTETVVVSGVSQKELHDKTLQFLAKFAKVPAASIQDDKEDKIVFKGYKKLNVKTDDLKTTFPLHYVLTVEFQDGSYKYKASDFSADGINIYNKESL